MDGDIYALKKTYFDTHIKIVLKENALKANKKREEELSKLIELVQIENIQLEHELAQLKAKNGGERDIPAPSNATDDDDTEFKVVSRTRTTSSSSKKKVVKAASASMYGIDSRRLYIRNIHPNTSEKTLVDYFSEFGDVEDISLPLDKSGDKNRTYAFITFGSFKKFPLQFVHTIDGRRVFMSQLDPHNSPQKTKFLLANGVLNSISVKDFTKYFSKYGNVLNVKKERIWPPNSKVRFAYIQFDSCESVEEAIKQPVHEIYHQIVDVRKMHESEINLHNVS